ncbi:hypothetical protein PS9374_06692 [Planomonospora sphaerica]|uniref:Htaa domain-containing protein n=1 Tax=Planomonospora sphaerica TaxID=161355 RepID=A0A171DPM3_9ACTN|nr:hypothetical protein PS9374_06692 [Planomonospora sphaerica]
MVPTARPAAHARALSAAILALTIGAAPTGTAHADTHQTVMLKGSTTASYFWDDGSGRNGDTGLPASGKPMQKGLAASPSWPLLTEGYVLYKGRKAPFFVGDRGPGEPSSRGIMLDLDAKTFAELTGGTFDAEALTVRGNGGLGHIKVDYVITKWGPGKGKKNLPLPFATGAYARHDDDPAEPVPARTAEAEPRKTSTEVPTSTGPAGQAGGGTTVPAAGGDRTGTVAPNATAADRDSGSTAAVSSVTDGPGGSPKSVLLVIAGVIGGGMVIGGRLLGRRPALAGGHPGPRHPSLRARGRHRRRP